MQLGDRVMKAASDLPDVGVVVIAPVYVFDHTTHYGGDPIYWVCWEHAPVWSERGRDQLIPWSAHERARRLALGARA